KMSDAISRDRVDWAAAWHQCQTRHLKIRVHLRLMNDSEPTFARSQSREDNRPIMMDWELGRFAARHFGHLNDRKEREAAAEQRLVQRFFDDRRDGVFIEVGANEPKRGSQSWHLEQIGWRGLLVEPIPALCEQLRAERPNARIVEAACGSPEQRGVADFNIAEQSSQSTLVRDKANVDIAFTTTVRVT